MKDFLKKGKKTIKVDMSELKCKICSDSFSNLDDVRKHLSCVHDKEFTEAGNGIIAFSLQTKNGVFSCHLCAENFHSFFLLNKHINVHYSNAICESCGKGFVSHTRLLQHKEIHLTGQYPCDKCKKMFTSLPKYKYHNDRIHRNSTKVKPSKCQVCEARFDHHYEKIKHLKDSHGMMYNYPCETCSVVFETRKSLYFHTKKYHTQNILCEVCNKPFAERNHLKKHMAMHTKARNFACSLCSKTYRYEKNLKDHMRVHNPDWKFACSNCWVGFQRATLVIRRSDIEPKAKIVLVHQTPQRRNAELILKHSTAYPFKTRFSQILCAYCHTEYEFLPQLKIHMENDHANADFGKVFCRMKGNLIKVDISDLECKICCRSIRDVDTLMRHFAQDHDMPVKFNACYGVLPYKLSNDSKWICVFCDKTYAAFIDFKRHITTHFMNYNCDKCGTTFISCHALREHQRQVKCHRIAYKPRNGRAMRPRSNAEIILQCSSAYPFRTWMSNLNCVFCRVKTRDPVVFRNHMASQHESYDVQAAFYKKLGKAFLNVDITNLQCKLCFMSIDNFEDLIGHLKNDHQQPIRSDAQFGVLPFKLNDGSAWKCAMCTNQFKDFMSLKKHTQSHFQNYVCDTCGEGFITESAMIAHTKIPHENRYNCGRCIATFSTLDERNSHVKTQHTSTRYVCVYCIDKPRFATWEIRKKHLLEVHNYGTGGDSYECTICQKSFKSRSGKYNHMARIHRVIKDSELSYTCGSCSRAFTSQLFLDKHIAKKHIDS
ncbi:unnamed protein product [Parnassius apollo]|uniref:(apollo) hypothetical protein n=1 Tax=Parnassius apollo TaxID=110799 RepID=A0A8S3Y7B2_PARAO|nr:unnamed protein product [Parnassius apollo]